MAKISLDLPADLLREVIRLSGAKTKSEAINIALESYLQIKKKTKQLSKPMKRDLMSIEDEVSVFMRKSKRG